MTRSIVAVSVFTLMTTLLPYNASAQNNGVPAGNTTTDTGTGQTGAGGPGQGQSRGQVQGAGGQGRVALDLTGNVADSSQIFQLDRTSAEAGRSVDQLTTARGQQNQGGGQGGGNNIFSNLGRLFGAGGAGLGQGAQSTTRRTLRTRIKVDIARSDLPNTPTPEFTAQVFQDRFSMMPTFRDSSDIIVYMQGGGTAVLTGTVATEKQRVMAERLAKVEPGVYRVENELLVIGGNGQ